MRRFEPDNGILRVIDRRWFRLALKDHRGDDRDPLLALLHEAAKLAPGVEASHARRLGVLGGDEHHVAEAVGVEARGCYEERFELGALATLERGDQFVECRGGEFLCVFCPHDQVLRERGFRFLH